MVARGFELIERDPRTTSWDDAVAAANEKAATIQRLLPIAPPGMLPPVEQLGNALGAVVGEAITEACGWEWVCLTVGGANYVVVASPDRAMICHPLGDLIEIVRKPGRPVTVLLNYNLFKDGSRLPKLPAKAYQLFAM